MYMYMYNVHVVPVAAVEWRVKEQREFEVQSDQMEEVEVLSVAVES